MLKEEFIARTGYTPTDAEYAAIEADYYGFDGDKDAYCKAFDVKKFHALQVVSEIAELRGENEKMKAQIATLRESEDRMLTENVELRIALYKEQEWESSDSSGTHMEQRAYECLDRGGYEMTDDAAKMWIHDNFGFDAKMVVIRHEASTMKVNRHGQLRVEETFHRHPIYEATDSNYVRFDMQVKGAMHSWEIVNGELKEYIE